MQQNKLLFPLLLVFYEIATYLSNDMYLPALPQMANDFVISHAQVQLSLTTWFLGATSLQILLGPLSDRCGRRPILLWGGVFFIISTAACALAVNFPTMLIARFIQGSAICSMVVAGYASIHELYDQRQAIRLLALMGSITVLAPAVGPLLGSLILTIANWRWIFWILVIWSSIAIALLMRWMPESHPPAKRQALGIKICVKNYISIVRNARFMKNLCVFGLIFCVFIAWLSAAPFVVATEFGYNTVFFSLAQMIIFAAYIFANRFIKTLMEHFGIDHLINIGMGMALFGVLCGVMFAIILPHFMLGIVISMTIYSVGAAFAFAPLNRITIESSEAPMGARMAIFSSAMSGSGVLGSVFASLFYRGTLLSLASLFLALILMAHVIRFGPFKVHRQ